MGNKESKSFIEDVPGTSGGSTPKGVLPGICPRDHDTFKRVHSECRGPGSTTNENTCREVPNASPYQFKIGQEDCRYYDGDAASTGHRAVCVNFGKTPPDPGPSKHDDWDTAKYNCCSKLAKDTTAVDCGTNYCDGSDDCHTFMSEYCKSHTDLVSCQEFVKDELESVKCQTLDNFPTASCQTFCDTQFNNKNAKFFTHCQDTAKLYCETEKGKTDQKCNCINAVNTPEYKKAMGLPGSGTALGNYQCYWPACVSAQAWSDSYRMPADLIDPKCLECVQNININGSDIDGGIGKIVQSCKNGPPGGGDGPGAAILNFFEDFFNGTPDEKKSKSKIAITSIAIIVFLILLLIILFVM